VKARHTGTVDCQTYLLMFYIKASSSALAASAEQDSVRENIALQHLVQAQQMVK